MASRGLFRGYALNAIDAKGRVAIPAPFRKTIEGNGNESLFVMGKHEADDCLVGYDNGWADILQAQIDAEFSSDRNAGRAFDKHNINRRANALTEPVKFDDSGRFIMSPSFRRRGKIENWVLFLGVGHVFEMWNPMSLIADPSVDDDVKEIARDLLTDRGVGL